ncbi:amino acid permease-domain-containing protein [Talaromyces proteolyticus]|uniref:Amino acid permease-domain-containing protein n=1 Tax=Talaromyces proteolyticus TaxID=1131652 RepID=A0AAD4KU09_9EURO|nr:amino acid permease-domain-containing protein [Talaromyces proteolyticus]KAH8699188.1 amino acid permease-domain-containing protein [Talaromyces proteolyticus]
MGLSFWPDKEKGGNLRVQANNSSEESIIRDGDIKFTAVEGANSTTVTYQDAAGAPVEKNSPLGYSVSFWISLFLNINQMVGTGIFSTPATILKGVGSVGLTMIYWFIGYLLSQSTLAVYLELSACFPSRSGSEVVYLEQAYPKPRYFFPTIFAIKHVVFAFASSNAIVFAEYMFGLAGSSYTAWQLKGVAVAVYTVSLIVVSANTKWSLRIVVFFGVVKIATLILISIAGLVVLGGHTKIADPNINWRNAWEGTSTASAYGATNAMIKIIFSYAGYTNAFGVINEIKNPTKTLRWSAPFSLLLVTVLYILVNVAYFSAASREEILQSKQIAAAIFFQKLFGSTNKASRALNVLICMSAFGNLVAVMINSSRILRETGRQGVLPWSKFWTNVKPFGTPLGPYVFQWSITIVMIIAPPAGDAFNFVVDLNTYPTTLFNFIVIGGLVLIRRRRRRLNLPTADYRAWDIAIAFSLLTNAYMLIVPWYPPTQGANGGDVSFWYGTYLVVSIGLLVLSGIYYYVWVILLPKWKGYELRQTVLEFENGSISHKLVKVPNEELARWDEEHDAIGHLRHRNGHRHASSDGF